MTRCRKRVLRIFGTLLLLALLFVPYRATHLSFKRDFNTYLIWRTTGRQSGFMFLPRLLRLRAIKVEASDQDHSLYSLNEKMLLAEIGIIVILGTLDYIFLCAWLKKTQK